MGIWRKELSKLNELSTFGWITFFPQRLKGERLRIKQVSYGHEERRTEERINLVF